MKGLLKRDPTPNPKAGTEMYVQCATAQYISGQLFKLAPRVVWFR